MCCVERRDPSGNRELPHPARPRGADVAGAGSPGPHRWLKALTCATCTGRSGCSGCPGTGPRSVRWRGVHRRSGPRSGFTHDGAMDSSFFVPWPVWMIADSIISPAGFSDWQLCVRADMPVGQHAAPRSPGRDTSGNAHLAPAVSRSKTRQSEGRACEASRNRPAGGDRPPEPWLLPNISPAEARCVSPLTGCDRSDRWLDVGIRACAPAASMTWRGIRLSLNSAVAERG